MKSKEIDQSNSDNKKSPKFRNFFSKAKDFFITSSNGMAMGLFATLIVGTIISTIALIFKGHNLDWTDNTFNIIEALATALKFATGFGIGLGIAYALKFDGLKLISGAISGFIASFISRGYPKEVTIDTFNVRFFHSDFGLKIGDPLTIFLVVIITLILIKLIFRKKTPIDIILIPLVTSIIALVVTWIINQPVFFVTVLFRTFFLQLSNLDHWALAALAGLVISVVMGMCLTVPMISSAAIAIIFSIDKVAGACAVVGCCCQMVGFAVQSYRDNGFAKSISVGIGTSMLQFKNIIKKPMIWLPTIMASAILGPIVAVLGYQCDASGAGMGTCGFVGQMASILGMADAGNMWWETAIFIGLFQIILPFVLVFVFDLIFRKAKLIKEGDLTL